MLVYQSNLYSIVLSKVGFWNADAIARTVDHLETRVSEMIYYLSSKLYLHL